MAISDDYINRVVLQELGILLGGVSDSVKN